MGYDIVFDRGRQVLVVCVDLGISGSDVRAG